MKKWLGQQTKCDVCGEELKNYDTFYDAVYKPTRQWALMCRKCWQLYGQGVGQGVGQEYRSSDNVKLR